MEQEIINKIVENKIKERMNFLIKKDFIFKEYNNFANINQAEKWLAMLAISTLIYTKDEFSKLYLKDNS